MCLAFTTSLADTAPPGDPHHPYSYNRVGIFIQTRVLLRFTALERVMRRLPLKETRYSRCYAMDDQSACLVAITTEYLIYATAYQSSPSRFHSQSNVKRRTMLTSPSFNSASTVPPNSHPFPHLRPQWPPKWDSCRLHKDTRRWQSSSQDVADRRFAH